MEGGAADILTKGKHSKSGHIEARFFKKTYCTWIQQKLYETIIPQVRELPIPKSWCYLNHQESMKTPEIQLPEGDT